MLFREWETRNGPYQFSGVQLGRRVNAQTVMIPFRRTAGEILSGISECVQYVGGSEASTSSRQVRSDHRPDAENAASDDDESLIPRVTMERKRILLMDVARRKSTSPDVYKKELTHAIRLTKGVKEAAALFGASPKRVAAYERVQALIDLEKGVDISEPEVIDQSLSQIEQEGKQEIRLLSDGQQALMKAKKISEASYDTVATY